MHGNVWNWCEDDWYDNYEGAPKDGGAWYSGNKNNTKVRRGGSWDCGPRYCRSAYRYYGSSGVSGTIGLRVVHPSDTYYSLDTYYYPFIKSRERICLQKEQAEGHIKREGGELIEVPTFVSEDYAQKWIKEQPNSGDWDVGFLDKTPFNPEIVYCVIREKL